MSSKLSSRSGAVKKEGNSRYGTRLLALEKGKRSNNSKDNSRKSCDCLLKSEKGSKLSQNSKVSVKKANGKTVIKEGKKGSSDHHEKVVIVSKRSSSVSVVKSCSLRKSVSVRKVSYSTSVVLSSEEDSEETEEEEDSEDERRSSRSRKKKTVVKHTISRAKSSYQKSKKSDRASKKAKAIKLLCDKLSSNKNKNERELRPRFPYSMFQEWPTARAHRMASLNALAKVHVLYENESRTTGENLKDADETSLIDFLNEENSDDDDDEDDDDDDDDDESFHMAIKSSSNSQEKKSEKVKHSDHEKSKAEKKPKPLPPVKRGKKRKISDVEIIDTRVCKRMASLNAQAILAASYVQEPKPRRINRKLDKCDSSSDLDVKEIIVKSKCDVEIIETEKKSSSPKKESNSTCDKNRQEKNMSSEVQQNESKNPDDICRNEALSPGVPPYRSSSWRVESDVAARESHQKEISSSDSIVSTTASTKVGVTQYTEVTKVQINSRNDLEVKEESKSGRKIERILGNDDVAITQMYHYQSKNANESYCVQMQTTYKPGSRNLSPAALSMSPPAPMHPHMGDPVLHGRPNYYGCSSHSPMLPTPPYHMNPAVGGMHPVMGMDHRIPHQYGGSAFSVPHYRHPQPMQFPHSDYGYYQPAGPLIQPHHDQYTIHKPVPYHPQPHLHQPPTRPQPPSSHRDSYNSLDPSRALQKGSPPISNHHVPSVKQNSALPLHSSLNESSPQASHSSLSYKPSVERSSQERGVNNLKPAPFSTSPKPISPSALHPSYPTHGNYRDYQKQKSPNSSGGYSKQCEPNVLPSAHNYNQGLPHNSSYQKNKHQSQMSHLQPRESGGHHDAKVMSRQQLEVPHHSLHSGPKDNHKIITDTEIKESTWSIKTNPEDDSPDAPVSFIPYPIEPTKEMPSVDISESSRYPIRPPSVIEIVEENSRDTKTYIQLEVPKNSHREKIVVVDVENDEINKDCDLPSTSKSVFNISQEKTAVKEIVDETLPIVVTKTEETPPIVVTKIEEPSPNVVTKSEENDCCVSIVNSKPVEEKCVDPVKESPEVMVIEVKKKKESAVVRRARLHGKQRTFRDAYNRPLVPLAKVKKNEQQVTDEDVIKAVAPPEVSLPAPLPSPKQLEKKFAHGWSWEGQAFDKQVYVSNDESPCIRQCYPAIKHVEGDVIHVRDCVLLRSSPRKTDLPFVAKITALWNNPVDGEMTMSLMWYYRPEHTETEKKLHHIEDEIFASKHKDTNSVACIEDKCYVLTYSEYCRYRKRCKLIEDTATSPTSIVPDIEDYPRLKRLPPSNVSPDLVFFCRKVYDFRQKRLLKNPV